MAARWFGVGLAAVLVVAGAPVEAQAPAPYVVVPYRSGSVYVPVDPMGRPMLPAGVPAVPSSPGAPATPAVPAAPPAVMAPAPAEARGSGYSIVPPADERSDSGTGSGYHVVPKP